MAKKRTRQEKELARLRRLVLEPQAEREEKTAEDPYLKTDFYVPELTLSVRLLKLDLTKAAAVTILALLLQIALAIYLNRGGWQFVNSVLLSRMSNF